MKVTLTPEPQTFTLSVGALKVPGVRENGELGPIKRLIDAKGRTLFLWDGRSSFQKAFNAGIGFLIGADAAECEVMGGSPDLIADIRVALKNAEATA